MDKKQKSKAHKVAFTIHYPNYYKEVEHPKASELTKHFLLLLDATEMEYRYYLGGARDNLDSVVSRLQELASFEVFDQSYFNKMMKNIENHLFEHEIDELKSKHFETKPKLSAIYNNCNSDSKN